MSIVSRSRGRAVRNFVRYEISYGHCLRRCLVAFAFALPLRCLGLVLWPSVVLALSALALALNAVDLGTSENCPRTRESLRDSVRESLGSSGGTRVALESRGGREGCEWDRCARRGDRVTAGKLTSFDGPLPRGGTGKTLANFFWAQ